MESFIPRIGGKRLLRKQIVAALPTDAQRYVEPFGGAGWILFSKDRHAAEEVFNDLDGELINLFRCVKYHANELQHEIQWLLNSRELFEDAMALKACRGLTDIQRAAMYFTVVKQSYGANCDSYGASAKNIERVSEYLLKVRQRLMMVKIENKPFDAILAQYDSEGTLFYLDPPYHGTESLYETPFGDEDHLKLRNMLGQVKGRFVLSYNDDSFIRSLYNGFEIAQVSRAHNLMARYPNQKSLYNELLIQNF